MKKKIVLNNSFYSSESIKKAVDDFSQAAKINMTDNSYTILIDSEDEIVAKEFANYILGLEKQRR